MGLVAVGAIAVTAAAGSDGWSLTMLKSDPDWAWVYVNDINDSGKCAGFWQDDVTFVSQAICWTSGSSDPKELEGLTGFTGSWASSVNNRGQIGGSVGQGPRHAVIWDKDGNLTDVHPSTPLSFNSQIWGMNDHGDACGILGVQGFFRAYRWWSDGSSELLPKSSNDILAARSYGMNKAGVVAGIEFPTAGVLNAVYWDVDGDVHEIHDDVVAANGDVHSTLAWKVTDQDEVIGIAFNDTPASADKSWAWVYTEENGVQFLDDDGTDLAVAWQSRGKYFAGMVNGNGNNPANAQAAIWVRGNDKGSDVYTLELLDTPDGYVYSGTSSVNTNGTAVGIVEDEEGNLRSWIATPHASGNKYK